jgi:hypothetical protein
LAFSRRSRNSHTVVASGTGARPRLRKRWSNSRFLIWNSAVSSDSE